MAARRNVKEACVREALKIIESKGVEQLSLRQVARRLRLSHQAPYKHFDSKDHILAEIIRRGFATFADYLQREPKTPNPRRNLRLLGKAYIRFALDYPLYYRLMFSSPHPNPRQHREMAEHSLAAFAILRDRIQELSDAMGADMQAEEEAFFVWSTMHGLASMLVWDHIGGLHINGQPLTDNVRRRRIVHVLNRIGDGLRGAMLRRDG